MCAAMALRIGRELLEGVAVADGRVGRGRQAPALSECGGRDAEAATGTPFVAAPAAARSMSSRVIRPPMPEPVMADTSTPRCRARRRTAGVMRMPVGNRRPRAEAAAALGCGDRC